MRENTPYTPDIFNILRAVALICIFGLHCTLNIKTYVSIHVPFFLFTPAWAAVWLLFSLSGFFIGKPFFEGKYDSWSSIKSFYLNRFIRIAIPYYLFLLVAFLFVSPVSLASLGWTGWLRLLTFTYNSRPESVANATWFISTLMQLYLLAPLIYHFILKKIPVKSMWVAMIGLLFTGLTLRHILLFNNADWHIWIYTFSIVQLDLFFVPFMLNAYSKYLPAFSVAWQRNIRIVSLSLLGISLFSCTHFLAYDHQAMLYLYTGPTIFTILFVLIAISCQRRAVPNPINLKPLFILRHPLHLLEIFAVITFDFYLYHSEILNVIPKILQKYPITSPSLYLWLTFGGGFLLATAWAAVMYVLLERPLNEWRKKLTDTAGL